MLVFRKILQTYGMNDLILENMKDSNLPIQIYINRINNRFVFKKKKKRLQTPETMKLLGSTKK